MVKLSSGKYFCIPLEIEKWVNFYPFEAFLSL
jgi:hypothetical protein